MQWQQCYDTLMKYVDTCPDDLYVPNAFSLMGNSVQQLAAHDSGLWARYRGWLESVLYSNTTVPEYFCACMEQIAGTFYNEPVPNSANRGVSVVQWLQLNTPCDSAFLMQQYENDRQEQFNLWQDTASGNSLFDTTLLSMAQLGLDSLLEIHFQFTSDTAGVPRVDTTIFNIPPSDSSALNISATTNESNHAILFQNASTNWMLLESIQIIDSTGIAFFGQPLNETAYLNDSLVPGNTSTPVLMTLEVRDTGSYDIGLLVTYRDALASQSYKVVAHRLPGSSSSVDQEAKSTLNEFALYPNPSNGSVTISVPQNGPSTVEIYDLLGNLLFRQNTSSRVVWGGGSIMENSSSSNVYIVRVLTHLADGAVALGSKRLIIIR